MSTTTTDDGGPAFPCSIDEEGSWYNKEANGMSLRDWFAGKALAGLLAKLPVIDQTGEFGRRVADKPGYNRDVANSCYSIADAMIAARKATHPSTL